MNPSLRRRIGSTDIQIPILGLGTAPIGGLYGPPVPDADAVALMRRAYELGIRAFDTAPQYGSGFAESRLGEVLPELPRDEIVVSTKVGRPLRPISFAAKTKRVLSESLRSGDVRRIAGDGVRITKRVVLGRRAGVTLGYPFDRGDAAMETSIDFSYDGVMRSVDDSLARLRLDRVDILYIHEPDDHYEAALGGAFKALDRLRSDGSIGAVGVGMNQTKMLVRFRPRGPRSTASSSAGATRCSTRTRLASSFRSATCVGSASSRAGSTTAASLPTRGPARSSTTSARQSR